MAAVLMVACNTNAVDPREKVIGAYDYVSGGQLNFSFMQEKFEIPLEGEGSFTISKYGDKDRLKIEIFNDSVFAVLSKDEILIEEPVYTMEIALDSFGIPMGRLEIEMEAANDKIQVVDSTLKWETDLEATIKLNGVGLAGRGPLSITANKKQTNTK